VTLLEPTEDMSKATSKPGTADKAAASGLDIMATSQGVNTTDRVSTVIRQLGASEMKLQRQESIC